VNIHPVPLRAATLLTLATLAGCGSQAQNDPMPPPPDVSVAEVVVRDVRQWDEFIGRVEAVESVELRPRVSGYIERIDYTEGGIVAKDDVLFVIDQRSYKAAHQLANAELERARTRTELTRSEYERSQRLHEARAVSVEELDQRAAAYAEAQAALNAARAALDVAALELEFTEVKSPIAGRAGRALVTAGNLAQADTTMLTTVVSLDPVYVYFEGDEQAYLRYNAMDRNGERPSSRSTRNPVRVAITGENGFPHEGEMDFMDNRVDPSTGTLRARALLPNPDGVFTPGLFARVQLLGSGTFRAHLIDDKAVLTDQDRKYVYVIGEDGTAQRRDVVLGRMVEGLRVVQQGLEAGDRVIVHGIQKVFFPGMPVNAHMIAMGDPPAAPAGPGPQQH
jgi:multidrug efflux system membrane fusion protein